MTDCPIVPRLCGLIDATVVAIGAALVAAFTLIILVDVVCRYWLKIPLSWVTELTVFLFQITCLVGASVALRRGLHFGLGTMLHDLAPALAKRLRPFVAMLVALMSLVMLGLAIKMSMQAWNSMYTTLPISQATVYVVMAITFAAMALFAIEPLISGEEATTT